MRPELVPILVQAGQQPSTCLCLALLISSLLADTRMLCTCWLLCNLNMQGHVLLQFPFSISGTHLGTELPSPMGIFWVLWALAICFPRWLASMQGGQQTGGRMWPGSHPPGDLHPLPNNTQCGETTREPWLRAPPLPLLPPLLSACQPNLGETGQCFSRAAEHPKPAGKSPRGQARSTCCSQGACPTLNPQPAHRPTR